ncbi:MAG: enoyl-CoA hydratase-related protein [Bacteriovoracaceae bacterium]
MGFEYIDYKEFNNTAIIKINRPEVYNALNKSAKAEIVEAISQANNSKEVRSIILTGEGKAFCSGQDLNDRSVSNGDAPLDLGYTLETEWIPLVKAIKNSSKIIIGTINGVCAGAGISIAFACDLIVSRSNVKFVSGFSKLGLCPDAGISYTFTRALGYHEALEFFLFNTPYSSEELKKKGLINVVSEDPLKNAKELSQKLNTLAPLSNKLIKENLQVALDKNFTSSLDKETSSQRELGKTEDYQEGLNAFFEKRAPNFKGQ